MNKSIPNRGFADMALLGVGNIEMRVGVMAILQAYEVVLELENVIFQISLKTLDIFSFSFSSSKLIPTLEQPKLVIC
jgi:hypothetical protein